MIKDKRCYSYQPLENIELDSALNKNNFLSSLISAADSLKYHGRRRTALVTTKILYILPGASKNVSFYLWVTVLPGPGKMEFAFVSSDMNIKMS